MGNFKVSEMGDQRKESDCNTLNAMKLEFLLNIKEGRYMRLKACGIRKIKKGQHLVKKIMTRPSNRLRFWEERWNHLMACQTITSHP